MKVNKKIKYILQSLILLVCFFTAFSFVKVRTKSFTDPANINSASAFKDFAHEYNTGTHADQVEVRLSLLSGNSFDVRGFEGLGKEERPFSGTIVIDSSATNIFWSDVPIFNYISSDARIVDESGNDREIQIIRPSEVNFESVPMRPLFAKHVTKGNNNTGVNWKIRMIMDGLTDPDNKTAYDFKGLIDVIEDDCKVSVEFTHDSIIGNQISDAKSSDSNIGLICNTLNERAILTAKVNIASEANRFVIESTSGHAGGLVGEMKASSKLIVDNTETYATDVKTTANNKYAGGLVGYMGDLATIEYTSAFTSNSNVEATNYIAGGLVGYGENTEFTTLNTITLANTVTGKYGAGGAFGKYNATKGDGGSGDTRNFDLSIYESTTSNLKLNSSNGYLGGIIGVLDASKNIVIDGKISHTSSNKDTFPRGVWFNTMTDNMGAGGLVGKYKNSSLTNTLLVKDNKVLVNSGSNGAKNSSGLIGLVDATNGSNYVNIKDVVISTTGSLSGGLIGKSGPINGSSTTYGNFIDIEGMTAFDGTYNATLVYNSNEGIIRIKGTTDLNGTYRNSSSCRAITKSGQLIGTRGNTLVYALGTGEDSGAANGWTLYRAQDKERYDDIYDWGEIIRVDGSTLKESDLFTVNMTNHTVTIKDATTSISSIVDFAKAALNIYHNDGGSHGALLLGSTTRTNLLSTTLNLTNNISLSETGLLGLTRDNGSLPAFTGEFNGNGNTITLAIGEDYSQNKVSAPTNNYSNSRGGGAIMRHQYIGLFAKTSSTANIHDLTINGEIRLVNASNTSKYIGALSAYHTGSLTINNVTINNTLNLYNTSNADNGHVYAGGLIGYVGSSSGTISITSSILNETINNCHINEKTSGSISEGIGYVENNPALTINVTNSTIDGSYNYNDTNDTYRANDKQTKFGGLIAIIEENGPTININTLNIGTLTINKIAGNEDGIGGLLGYQWLNVTVNIGTKNGTNDGLIIGDNTNGPTINVPSNSGNSNIGGLVYIGTGVWKVNNVKLNKFIIDSEKQGTFGFIVNKGAPKNIDNALYLELFSEKYNISSLDVGSSNFTVYDEVVAYSHFDNNNLENNGQAIVSISAKNSSGTYILEMDGSKTNTYQNQTAYGQTSDHQYNSNCRYYYNLDTINAKASKSDAEKLLLWSIYNYAHDSIKTRLGLTNPLGSTNQLGSTFAGNFDMNGLSYYPIHVNGDITIGNSTIVFYNKEIENGESGSGNSDSFNRTTIFPSIRTQHHLMHHSLFLDYKGELNITGNLVLQGNISESKITGNGNVKSGYLISGTLGGDSLDTSEFNCSGSIKLDGIYIHNISNENSSVKPLLIYYVGTNTTVTIDNVSMDNYDTFYSDNTKPAATSLIGDVGDNSASNINLNFSRIALDSRKQAIASANQSLTDAYSSTKSIFSRATLLNSFRYNSFSSGYYNFELSDDWDGSNPLHQVTYGYEITHSAEFENLEKNYFNSAIFVNPTTNNDRTGTYSFDSTYFLPYVCVSFNESEKKHELSVNVASVNVTSGCGKYNDPYIITDGGQFVSIAKVIYGEHDASFQIKLPSDIGGVDMWCDDSSTDYIYVYDGSKYTSTGKPDKGANDVRKYLAAAYYLIQKDITIPAGFLGLGAVSGTNANYSSEYAFRGVIVGNGTTPTVTNESNSPFIKSSNGSVIKNINFVQKTSIAINQTANAKFRYDGSGCANFGVVIGQVMGGDNIIDKVGVSFSDGCTISFTSNKFNRLAPVGGYIGVVLNGAVIFRNMASVIYASRKGIDESICDKLGSEASKWLYVNPIIGRVIAGFAVCESNSYKYDEAQVTMKNSVKNYSIPDINPNASKIEVTADSATTHTITLPADGQSLFLLAALINCGACSAVYNTSTEQAYAKFDNNETRPWFAYRSYTCVRNGTYDYVGNTDDPNYDDDYVNRIAGKDLFNSTGTSALIPYIIRNYTSTNNNMYRARSISNGNGSESVKDFNFTNGTYYLPASYRGIGSLYYISDYTIMVLKNLDGKDATIHFSTWYEEYDAKNGLAAQNTFSRDSYATRQNENYGTTNFSGLGLFGHLKQLGVKNSASSSSIHNLKIQGSIFFDMHRLDNGLPISYKWSRNDEDGIGDDYVINIGGVAGTIAGKPNKEQDGDIATGGQFRIENITLDGINFVGAKFVGGVVGLVHRSSDTTETRILTKCGSTSNGITIIAGATAGGLIGLLFKHFVRIDGGDVKNPTDLTTLYINEVKSKGQTTAGKTIWWLNDRHIFTAGGLIGLVDAYDNKNTDAQKYSHSYFNNYRIIGVYESGNETDPKIYNSITDVEKESAAGGIIGASKSARAHIDNIFIEHVNIKAIYVGGLCGIHLSDKVDTFYNVNNFIVDGKISGSINSYFKGVRAVGGLFGYVETSQTLKYDVDESGIRNLDLISEAKDGNTGRAYAVGGFIGYRCYITNNTLFAIELTNYFVDKCSIESHYTKIGEHIGTGGLAGALRGTTTFNGYNILINDTNINRYNGSVLTPDNNISTVTYVVGNNYNGSAATIKLVGVSIHNTNSSNPLRKLVDKNGGTTDVEYYGTDGYIILADYNGICTDEDNSQYNSTLSTNTYDPTYPYVTINPKYNIGNGEVQWTGDGLSSTVDGLVINNIINDTSNRYLNALKYNSGSYKTIIQENLSKLSTYNSEQADTLPNDFAVLVVDSLTKETTTKLINAYINLLCNTKQPGSNYKVDDINYNYAINLSNVYSTRVVKMVYDEGQGKFVESNEAPNLIMTGGEFFMRSGNVDTAGRMFSLIEVSFYNPANTSEVAYCIYIPVLVKKILKFDFSLATLSGTDYNYTHYDDERFGKPLIENLGTPVTLYFKYSYFASKTEWQSNIDSGESFIGNYNKILDATKTSASSIPPETILVLVDVNRGGVPYYGYWRDVYVNGNIVLTNFKKSLLDYSTPFDSNTSESFSPLGFGDLLDITVTRNDSSGLFVTCAANDSEACYYSKENDTYYKLAGENASAPKYAITVNNDNASSGVFTGYVELEERYYISIFTNTENSNHLYHYEITSPSSLTGYVKPSRIVDVNHVQSGQGYIHLFMGNIFVQESEDMVVEATNDNLEIYSENDTLSVNMETTVKINSELYDQVRGYLGAESEIQIYQSFLLYLIRKSPAIMKIITGNPRLSGSFSIGAVNSSVDQTQDDYSDENIRMTSTFIEWINGVSLNRYLTTGAGAVIRASVDLEYIGDEAISEQFPLKEDRDDDSIGLLISASSNLSFDQEKGATSKAFILEDDVNGYLYYCYSASKKAHLAYNAKNDFIHGELGYLGINPKDSDGLTEIKIPTLAILDISSIYEDAIDYDIVRCTINLSSKVDGYASSLNFDDYWTALYVNGNEVAIPTDEDEIVFMLDRSATEDFESEYDTTLSIPISFDVLTGTPFEEAGLTYSNYRIWLKVELIKENGNGGYTLLETSIATNFLIYTNARIIPDFLD